MDTTIGPVLHDKGWVQQFYDFVATYAPFLNKLLIVISANALVKEIVDTALVWRVDTETGRVRA